MDVLDDFFGLLRVEILPSLEEVNESVTLVEVPGEEGLDVFVRAWLDKLLIRFEGADEVRNSSLGLIKKLWQRYSCLLTATTSPNFRNLSVVYHVVVAHECLCLLSELVGLKDSPFIVFFILQFED